MVATIGFVSGFLVADNSMLLAYQDGFEKYNIEDGNFRTADRIYRSQREDIEKLGITLYENYYIEADTGQRKYHAIFQEPGRSQ